MIPKSVKSILRPYYHRLLSKPVPYSRATFSENGEDMLLQSFFSRKAKPGFYVDVGAFHPHRYSVTQLFYIQGWRGINIEPRPGSKQEFDRWRPRDINLEVGVADRAGTLTYFQFDEPVFNGFFPHHTAAWQERYGVAITAQSHVSVQRLDTLLETHLPSGQEIDFLTVDVEGGELSVLQSNDWTKFRPDLILLEDLNSQRLEEVLTTPVTHYLAERGYSAIGKTRRTLMYRQNERIDAAITD